MFSRTLQKTEDYNQDCEYLCSAGQGGLFGIETQKFEPFKARTPAVVMTMIRTTPFPPTPSTHFYFLA
ncbi:hypothetical protein M0802_004446 [Mischocyttarus mexicanus]|nr:hypothetical protein M0802_004446 [Mischocyttarus mexicanus]